jgi:hypothetical protein
MSRAPLFALLLALALAATIGPVAGWAAPRDHGEDQADAAPQALLLPKSAIAAAVRRTAVADPDLNGEATSVEAAQYYERRLSLLDENRDGSVDRPEFVRAVAVRSLYAVDGFAQPRPLLSNRWTWMATACSPPRNSCAPTCCGAACPCLEAATAGVPSSIWSTPIATAC